MMREVVLPAIQTGDVKPVAPRLPMLDGLRGLCALAIMFYHYLYYNGIELFQIGTFGVYIFFILSGFSLWYVYSQKPCDALFIRKFFVGRFARIFPLFALMSIIMLITIMASVNNNSLEATLVNVILNITFLFGFINPGASELVTGGWSIGIEWIFYLLFPLFIIFARRLWVLTVLLIFACAFNQLYTHLLFQINSFANVIDIYTQIVTFLVYFIGGMCTAEYFLRLQSRGAVPQGLLSSMGLRIIPLVCVCIIFFYPSTTVEAFLNGPHYPGLLFAALVAVLCAAFVKPVHALEMALYKFLGDISFSVYLSHYFVYTALKKLLIIFSPELSAYLLIMVSAFVTIVIAWLLYKYYEAPSRNYINRRFAGQS